MRPSTAPLALAKDERAILRRLTIAQDERDLRTSQRACVLLLAADGVPNSQIGTQVGVSPATVKAWRQRFEAEGLNALGGIRPGRGRKPQITEEKVLEIVHATLHEAPPGGGRWTCRKMAQAKGISAASVQRLWAAHDLKPSMGAGSALPLTTSR